MVEGGGGGGGGTGGVVVVEVVVVVVSVVGSIGTGEGIGVGIGRPSLKMVLMVVMRGKVSLCFASSPSSSPSSSASCVRHIPWKSSVEVVHTIAPARPKDLIYLALAETEVTSS